MKLNQMYTNILSLSLEEAIVLVTANSEKRAKLIQSMSKNVVAPKSRASIPKLSESEKAILKALGLSMKDVKALQGGTNGLLQTN